MAKKKEMSFLILMGLLLVFFGLQELTTIFFTPSFGSEVYHTIDFFKYAITIGFALMALIYISTKKPVPNFPWYTAIAKFVPSFLFFHFFFSFLFGAPLTFPSQNVAIVNTLISFLENSFGLVMLPYIVHEYVPQGTTYNVFGFDIPDGTRVLGFIPPTAFMTLLHPGAYVQQITDINSLYVALVINFFMFLSFRWLLEVLGFGVSEGAHDGFNTAQMAWRGSVM
jgi:hypothetical protein